MGELTFKLRVRYDGGFAEDNRLDLYDGSKSIHGLARSLQIVTHGFIHHDVIHQATALKQARLYILPSRQGSFINDVLVTIQQHPYAFGVATGVAANAFYDFLKFTTNKAVGEVAKPYTPYVSKLNTKDEPFFDALGEAMEGSLLDGHRTIQETGGTVTLERPRSALVKFNKGTLDWVSTRDENPDEEVITGNITRYNVLSGNGRLYDQGLKKTVPFRPDHDGLYEEDLSLLSWSLDMINNGRPGSLDLTVRRIVSARGDTKRYILVGCTKHIPTP